MSSVLFGYSKFNRNLSSSGRQFEVRIEHCQKEPNETMKWSQIRDHNNVTLFTPKGFRLFHKKKIEKIQPDSLVILCFFLLFLLFSFFLHFLDFFRFLNFFLYSFSNFLTGILRVKNLILLK